MGDRAKYIGIIIGIVFAALIMTQQPSIFVGLMTRTFGFIEDTNYPDIWVADPKVQFIDDIKPLQDTQLYRVRGVEGVASAVPMYKGLLRVRLHDGNFQSSIVVGVDDATLIGGPPMMIQGKLEDLRRSDSIIVNQEGAEGRLARTGPDGKKIPLKIGDTLELNDKRAIVVGIAKTTRTFQSQPVIYTTYARAVTFAPRERKLLSFVLVKAKEGIPHEVVTERIRKTTGLAAYTVSEFKELTFYYFMNNTGIPINFGISTLLGFLVGAAIAGQTFFNFTQDNLRQFGALKAMGTSNFMLLKMIVFQAITAGIIGWGIGVGLATYFGYSMKGSPLAFKMPWQVLVFSGTGILLIITIAALISIIKVIRLEPAIVFRS